MPNFSEFLENFAFISGIERWFRFKPAPVKFSSLPCGGRLLKNTGILPNSVFPTPIKILLPKS